MPLDADQIWRKEDILTGAELKALIEQKYGPLVQITTGDPSETARRYTFSDGIGEVGFINPVSEPFCSSCDRIRLTADGQLRTCLFATEETDLRAVSAPMPPTRYWRNTAAGSVEERIEALHWRQAVQTRKSQHVHDWRLAETRPVWHTPNSCAHPFYRGRVHYLHFSHEAILRNSVTKKPNVRCYSQIDRIYAVQYILV